MKKIYLTCASALAVFLSTNAMNFTKVHAKDTISNSEENVVEEHTAEDLFYSLTGDQKVLPLPEGGYLVGSCTVVDADDESTVYAIYDSELDPNAITVSEVKQEINEEKKYPRITPRGATVPTVGSLYFLSSQKYYLSDTFSGSGWRFSNYMFKPSPSYPSVLEWTSQNDSGRVGVRSQALSTYNGTTAGTSLPAGKTISFNGNDQGQIYYTYNPLANTRYLVRNPN